MTPVRAKYLRAPRIQVKVQRAAPVSAQRHMIQLARDVPRDITYNEAHYLLVDPAGARLHGGPDRGVEVDRCHPASGERRQVDESANPGKRMECVLSTFEVELDEPLPRHPKLLLLYQLAPRIRACVLDRTGVEGVRCDLAEHMIVAERDVIPRAGIEVLVRDLHRRPLLEGTAVHDTGNFTMNQEHVAASSRVRLHRNARTRKIRNGKDREIALGKEQPPGLRVHNVDAQRNEQPQDAAGFRGARCVVISRDHDNKRVGERIRQPRELVERVQDRRVRWADLVKNVATQHDQVRTKFNGAVHGCAERSSNIRFALIYSGWRLPLVLAKA
jgi:hypothetical protein